MARYFENGVCNACGMREIWWKKLGLCKECYSSGIKASATNAYEKWSTEDDLFVKEKILEGVYQKDIAAHLKRTPSAISKRVKHFTDHENELYDTKFTLKYRKKDFSLIYDRETGNDFKIVYFQAKFENTCSKCGKSIKIGDLICKPENSKGFFVHEWHLFENLLDEPARTQKPSPKSNEYTGGSADEGAYDYDSNKVSQSDRIRICPKCKKKVWLNSKNTQFRANQFEHIQCPTEKQNTRKKSTLTDEESTRLFFGDTSEFVYDSELEKARKKADQDYYEKKRDERASRDN